VVTTSSIFRKLEFHGRWHRYQELALQAVDHDLAQGRWRTHIVAPPGSGKTLLGVEVIRRLAQPALVLVPNTAVQAQWLHAVQLFGGDSSVAAPDTSAPIAILTYQSLCQLDDPASAIGNIARRRWAEERAKATASMPEAVDGGSLDGRSRSASRARGGQDHGVDQA
jgi:superfamily II DNA or RNA helicase